MSREENTPVLMLVVLLSFTVCTLAQDIPTASLKTFKLEREMSKEARDCIDCHAKENPGLVGDWIDSRHANMNISCYDCHTALPADSDINKNHYEYSKVPISTIVSPKDCSRCLWRRKSVWPQRKRLMRRQSKYLPIPTVFRRPPQLFPAPLKRRKLHLLE